MDNGIAGSMHDMISGDGNNSNSKIPIGMYKTINVVIIEDSHA